MTMNARTALRERPTIDFRMPETTLTIASDIPEGMTIGGYRRARPTPRKRNALTFRRRG